MSRGTRGMECKDSTKSAAIYRGNIKRVHISWRLLIAGTSSTNIILKK
jgi:hypothetical protein